MPHTKRVHFSLQNNATISVVKMFKVIILINGSQLCCKAFSTFQSTPPKIWSISIDYDLRDHYLIRVFLLLSSSSLLMPHKHTQTRVCFIKWPSVPRAIKSPSDLNRRWPKSVSLTVCYRETADDKIDKMCENKGSPIIITMLIIMLTATSYRLPALPCQHRVNTNIWSRIDQCDRSIDGAFFLPSSFYFIFTYLLYFICKKILSILWLPGCSSGSKWTEIVV